MISDEDALSTICSAATKDGAKIAANISKARVLAAYLKRVFRRCGNKKTQTVCSIFMVNLIMFPIEP